MILLVNPNASKSNFIWCQIDKIARQRMLSIMLVGLLSFCGCMLWSAYRGAHIPYINDEYSYLLAGETFAHGHVTNPTHPMWMHFETFYTLQRPTYMSIYPPAQGVFIALGDIMGGKPIYGIWLSSALMCAAITWMLFSWLPARWAFMGGLVAVLQFGIFTYWNQSYWGGAVGALGGALILGALPRILKYQRMRDALWMGLGCVVLANSRPLEGFLVTIPVACLVLPWKVRLKRSDLSKFIKKIIFPLGIILCITAYGMGEYNKKITGDAHIFPHFLYDNTYTSVPLLIFQPMRPLVQFNNVPMARMELDWKHHYFDKRTVTGFIQTIKLDIFLFWVFYFGFPLAIPSLAIVFLLFRNLRMTIRYTVASFILLCACSVLSFHWHVHYFSPLTGLFVLFITVGLRGLATLSLRKWRVGLGCVILLIGLQFFFDIALTPVERSVRSLARNIQIPPVNLPVSFSRENLKNILIKRGGRYLVIVKYSSSHDYFNEWVHNDADIDHAPVVWARQLNEEQDKELLKYFKDRQVLRIDVFKDTPVIPDYPARQ